MPRRTYIYCPNSHVIGELVRRELDGEQVTALHVYEHSCATSGDVVSEKLPVKRFLAIGYAIIECTICRREQVWTISNKTAVAIMIGLLNELYTPASRRDSIVKNCNDV